MTLSTRILSLSSLIGFITSSSSYYSSPTALITPTVILAPLTVALISLSFSLLLFLFGNYVALAFFIVWFGPINSDKLLARSISTAAYTTFWRRVWDATQPATSLSTRATLLHNGQFS